MRKIFLILMVCTFVSGLSFAKDEKRTSPSRKVSSEGGAVSAPGCPDGKHWELGYCVEDEGNAVAAPGCPSGQHWSGGYCVRDTDLKAKSLELCQGLKVSMERASDLVSQYKTVGDAKAAKGLASIHNSLQKDFTSLDCEMQIELSKGTR